MLFRSAVLPDFDLDEIAGRDAADEVDLAVDPRDPVRPVGERLDAGDGHGARLSQTAAGGSTSRAGTRRSASMPTADAVLFVVDR